jgi:hypothetical protein
LFAVDFSHGIRPLPRPVFQHRDAVRDLENLFEPVRDVDNADTGLPQLRDDTKQRARLGFCQRRGRLVEDEQLRVQRERLGNLDHLLLGGRKILQQRGRLDRESDARQQRAGLRVEFRAVNPAPPTHGLARGEDVFGDAERAEETALLKNDGDAELLRRVFTGDINIFAIIEFNRSLVRSIDPGEDVHQGAFARAILPNQRMNLPGVNIELNVSQCMDTGESFVDSAHSQHRFADVRLRSVKPRGWFVRVAGRV